MLGISLFTCAAATISLIVIATIGWKIRVVMHINSVDWISKE